ncbi:ADP-ribose-binding protein [Thermocrinis sp.]
MQIEIMKGSLLEVQADAIVNPANSLGLMGGGVAGVIKKFAGEEVEQEVISKAPIEVGTAILTSAGRLKFKGVIHAPTMEEPAMATTPEKVKKAVRASLQLADELGFESLAIPGMGTGVGKLPKDLSAKVMLEEIKNFQPYNLKRVILVDIDEEMVQAWKENL